MNGWRERVGRSVPTRILAIDNGHIRESVDELAAEEPLEIRLAIGSRTQSVAVTMRTPGNDLELAAGFLFAEGIIAQRDDLLSIAYCTDRTLSEDDRDNVVTATLASAARVDPERFERHFTMTSACGVCGKATIESLQTRAAVIDDDLHVSSAFIASLPDRMRKAQQVFASTGGLHAAALFDEHGELAVLREDIGRHNALDKVLGWALLNRRLPLRRHVLLLSGRASYELVQKSIVAGIPILCAVSAPSSLAVQLAEAFGITLAGFVRGARCNVYARPERIDRSTLSRNNIGCDGT